MHGFSVCETALEKRAYRVRRSESGTSRTKKRTAKPSVVDRARTAFVILEYRGGTRTDALHARLSRWNPGATIHVLDNASPGDLCSVVTHRNTVNSYVGGGIRDCIALAESLGAAYLFYSANDVDLVDPLRLAEFEAILDRDPRAVMVSCALTEDSH